MNGTTALPPLSDSIEADAVREVNALVPECPIRVLDPQPAGPAPAPPGRERGDISGGWAPIVLLMLCGGAIVGTLAVLHPINAATPDFTPPRPTAAETRTTAQFDSEAERALRAHLAAVAAREARLYARTGRYEPDAETLVAAERRPDGPGFMVLDYQRRDVSYTLTLASHSALLRWWNLPSGQPADDDSVSVGRLRRVTCTGSASVGEAMTVTCLRETAEGTWYSDKGADCVAAYAGVCSTAPVAAAPPPAGLPRAVGP